MVQVVEKLVDGKIVITYDDSRVFTMKTIGEKVCLATMDLLKEELSRVNDIKIKRILHAKKLSGSSDLIIEVSLPKYQLNDLYNILQQVKKESLEVGNIILYADIDQNQ